MGKDIQINTLPNLFPFVKDRAQPTSHMFFYLRFHVVYSFFLQIVIMLYEDPTKAISSDERFHVELHFSPGVNCCVQKENVPGPGFNPKSKFLRHDSKFFEKPCCIQTSISESITPPTPFTASFNCNKDNLDRILEKNSDTEVSSNVFQKLTENSIDCNYTMSLFCKD